MPLKLKEESFINCINLPQSTTIYSETGLWELTYNYKLSSHDHFSAERHFYKNSSLSTFSLTRTQRKRKDSDFLTEVKYVSYIGRPAAEGLISKLNTEFESKVPGVKKEKHQSSPLWLKEEP